MWRLYEKSGLNRSHALHWNAVPWYVGEGGHEKSVKAGHAHLWPQVEAAFTRAADVCSGR